MAKILFVSEKINNNSWSLASALKLQGNEVHFLTTKNQAVTQPHSFEILSFFNHWNTFEALRFLPFLAIGKYDVVHFLLESDRLNKAQSLLTTLSYSIPNLLLSTSLLDISTGLTRKNPVRYLLERSHLVTAPTIEMLAQLRGLNIKNHKQLRGILPPIIPFFREDLISSSSDKTNSFATTAEKKEFAVVPLIHIKNQSHEKFLLPLIELSKKFFIIFLGSLEGWPVSERKIWEKYITTKIGQDWCLSGQLPLEQEKDVLNSSAALFLAGQDLSPLIMTEWVGKSASSNTALIIDDRQTRLYPGLWEHKKNAWIFSRVDLSTDVERWVKTGPFLLSSTLSESLNEKQNLLDAPLNELQRLYNRLIYC